MADVPFPDDRNQQDGILRVGQMYKVIFYSDSDFFGGHEKMAVAAHAACQRHGEPIQIQWLINARNRYLADALGNAGLNYATLVDAPSFSLRGNPLRAFWKILGNASKLRRLSPDLIMVVQGNIAHCYDGVLSALMSGIRCCSYIPMVFCISDVKKRRCPALWDFAWSLLYRTISSYITIDPEQATRLRRENGKASVYVVENYVPKNEPLDIRQHARTKLGIPPDKKVLALIGRIEFQHKCQDWAFRELKNDPFLTDKFVLFVGDGSDSYRLRAMLAPEVRDRFGLIGWTDDLREVYAASDVLLIPSKVEGVPLVMLEALGYRVPVVGSDRDGMRSWLPAQWRFVWGDVEGFKLAIQDALNTTMPEVWENIADRLALVHDDVRFATQFSRALTRCCDRRMLPSSGLHDPSKESGR
jgi:glycosyltransferase involved in cell wall biosynthesis